MTALILAAAAALAAPVPADKGKADAEFAKKVDTARAKAIMYLKKKQNKDGNWEGDINPVAGLTGGSTALATLALLEAGVPINDPAITKALEYLRKLEPSKTYVVSLQIQVLARTKEKKDLPQIQTLADWLIKQRIVKDGKLQGWSYPGITVADGSNTHFAVIGLQAATQAGAKVDAKVWPQLHDLYLRTQVAASGGWIYMTGFGRARPTRSMTAAALLGLTVVAKYDKAAKKPDAAFEKGMKALIDGKLGDGMSGACEGFTVAELGRALGTTQFTVGKTTKVWYHDGAEKLVKEQQTDGSWKGMAQRDIDGNQPVITTAFWLYFLGAARAEEVTWRGA